MFALGAISLPVATGVIWTLWQAHRGPDKPAASQFQRLAPWPSTPWLNAQPDVKYVGDSACARCHPRIAETFRRHPMGRSLAPIGAGQEQPDSTVTFEAGESRYTVERRSRHVIHRESRIDDAGHVLAQVEAEVKYSLGAGTRGISYLIEHDGRLFQSPISWYRPKNRLDISPGYDVNNSHFDRPIVAECLFCHANRVEPVAHTLNRYEPPIFRGEAIGCERCPGPGELHVRHPERVDGRDLTIVNPQHLEPPLRDAVCEQCHLQGDHRIDRLGRDMFDYRPGLPLIEFFAIFGRTDQDPEGQASS